MLQMLHWFWQYCPGYGRICAFDGLKLVWKVDCCAGAAQGLGGALRARRMQRRRRAAGQQLPLASYLPVFSAFFRANR